MNTFGILLQNADKKYQGFIYKIQNQNGEGLFYIGSTRQERLCCRMNNHRSKYRAYKKGKSRFISVFKIFDEIGLDNCVITSLETFYFNNKI
mgnify:CR=1 FL=1